MQTKADRRKNVRLALSYPIEVQVREGEGGGTRGVTSNLCARGAYFKTFAWECFGEGDTVDVSILVPHVMQDGRDLIQLHLKARGRIRRLETIRGREALGEDGLVLKGIAVEFADPLRFDYYWA